MEYGKAVIGEHEVSEGFVFNFLFLLPMGIVCFAMARRCSILFDDIESETVEKIY